MPTPKAPPIQLSETEASALSKRVKSHKTSQQVALRGRIIQAASRGQSNSQISDEFGVSRLMVRLWRTRWLDLQGIELTDLSVADRLSDLPRPGAPPTITADQRCQIEALACEKPEGSDRPISQWTQRELADEIVKRGIVPHISARHAGRLLKRSRYQTSLHPLLADPESG